MTPDPAQPTAAPPAADPFNLAGFFPKQEERTWAMLAHVGGMVGFILAPLMVLMLKADQSRWVRAHAVEALNFQLTMILVYVAVGLLSLVVLGPALLVPTLMASYVLSLMAGVRAWQGGPFRYPVLVRLIKS